MTYRLGLKPSVRPIAAGGLIHYGRFSEAPRFRSSLKQRLSAHGPIHTDNGPSYTLNHVLGSLLPGDHTYITSPNRASFARLALRQNGVLTEHAAYRAAWGRLAGPAPSARYKIPIWDFLCPKSTQTAKLSGVTPNFN